MIIVIADDFTGAAEMAGISLGYGLKVSLCLDGSLQGDADVYIISTDSRSMNTEAALQVVRSATLAAAARKPRLLFKKIDSVLRGYVADELNVQMEVLGVEKALILPANPSLGRTIKNGRYFIDGIDISHTGFARDPEFAILSSDVAQMLDHPVTILNDTDSLQSGLNIASAATVENVDHWAAQVDASCIAAGSGDFFDALLKRQFTKKSSSQKPQSGNAHVYVSGTSFNKSVELIKYFGSSYTAYINSDIIENGNGREAWIKKAEDILGQHGQLIVAFDETINPSKYTAAHLRFKMADHIKALADEFALDELLIEGGSTATAIFQAFGVNCFEPVYEWERGVVQMKAGELLITVKPGSYNLPELIRKQYKLYEDV